MRKFSNTKLEVMMMSKAGMRRPDPKEPHGTESNHKAHFTKNDVAPVPEIQGKAKLTKDKAKPVT
ncbi:hypothetical protein V6615_06815 [Oscillospiraceae bacterium PP1C4]